MSNLFSLPELKNKVSRNGFDLQKRVIASAKFGEILPMWHKECFPGDHFQIHINNFSRTPACSEAAFTRFRHYFDVYFVPYRLLWRDFPSFVTSMANTAKQATSINTNRIVGSSLPFVSFNDLQNFLFSLSPDGKSECAWRGDPRNTTYDSSTCDSIFKGMTGKTNINGYSRGNNTAKLLQYLGYYRVYNPLLHSTPNNDSQHEVEPLNPTLNLFPLLAYQKIYYDYFRNSQWEVERAECYNIDYLNSGDRIPISNLAECYTTNGRKPTMFDLHYCNYQKDLFTGILPSQQYGAVSTVDIEATDFSFRAFIDDLKGSDSYPTNNYITQQDGYLTYSDPASSLTDINNPGYNHISSITAKFDHDIDNILGSFSILELRAAQAKQKFLEIALTNQQDYKSQIEAHFGVKVSSLMSGLCDYVGGVSGDFTLSTIANTNLVDGNSAHLNAIGTASADGNLTFDCKEHGILMCVYHALPILEYAVQAYDMSVLKTTFDDFVIPEFDKLGLENVSNLLLNGSVDAQLNIGYNSRYYEYKTDYDIVLGALNSNLLGTLSQYSIQLNNSNFHLMRMSDDDEVYYEYFKVNPNVTNSLFGVNQTSDPNTDVIYLCTDFDVKAIRNLDRDGLPY